MFEDDSKFQEALKTYFGIRECSVKLLRIEQAPKRKLLSTDVRNSVRSHVIWLPTVKGTVENSAAAISALVGYQKSEVGIPATQASSAIKGK